MSGCFGGVVNDMQFVPGSQFCAVGVLAVERAKSKVSVHNLTCVCVAGQPDVLSAVGGICT